MCVALGVDMFDCVYPTRTAVCSSSLSLSDNLEIWTCNYTSRSTESPQSSVRPGFWPYRSGMRMSLLSTWRMGSDTITGISSSLQRNEYLFL